MLVMSGVRPLREEHLTGSPPRARRSLEALAGAERAVVVALGLVVIAIAHLASGVPSAHANATQYGYFQSAYPSSPLSALSSAPPSNSCLVCHPTTSGPASLASFFNVYG